MGYLLWGSIHNKKQTLSNTSNSIMNKFSLISLALLLISSCNYYKYKNAVGVSVNIDFCDYKDLFGDEKKLDSVKVLYCIGEDNSCGIRASATTIMAVSSQKDTVFIFETCGKNKYIVNHNYRFIPSNIVNTFRNDSSCFQWSVVNSRGTFSGKYKLYFGRLE
jgi:hypothetical protein